MSTNYTHEVTHRQQFKTVGEHNISAPIMAFCMPLQCSDTGWATGKPSGL